MIILRHYEPRVFVPVPRAQWREPSESVRRDESGNLHSSTVFEIIGCTSDGVRKFEIVFGDRDDFDAFTHDLIRWKVCGDNFPQENWHLPSRIIGDLSYFPFLEYHFATVTTITNTSTGLSYSRPADWNDGDNSISVIGGGASGAIYHDGAVQRGATGGGGGAFAGSVNLSISGSNNYQVGPGGAAVPAVGSSLVLGNNGTDTWFGGSNFASALVGAKAGVGGKQTASGTGGTAAASIGSTKYSGGNSGTSSGSNSGCSGGGGGGGPTGAGGASSNVTSTRSAGGSGGGGGGAGGAANSSAAGGAGSNMLNNFGSGGGSGGRSSANTGTGGAYGGGSGGIYTAAASTTGAGSQGLIQIVYEPLRYSAFNSPMMGM